MGKGRTEAFSDGVFSIAITLLILEIKVPPFLGQSNRELAWALLSLWPSFFAFVGSFATILVLWINHHGLFTLAEHATPEFLFANGFLLLLVIFLPFPTALLARHLTGPGANTAAVVYCGTYVLTNISYYLLLSAVASPQSIRKDIDSALVQRIRITYMFGSLIYIAATIVAWFHAFAGVLICSLPWLLWTHLSYSNKAGQK
ncbi:MAG TPA: TMEM175 family protein [Methylococcales bacterium]|jgi:uncharacterized membrane protein